MGSRKRGGTKGSSSSHLRTLHQRLYSALNLGTIYSENRKTKWECKDIEIQRHVLRSIAAFLDGVTRETRHDPLVKDSESDIIGAMVEILHQKNGAIITMAADLVVKLVNVLTYSTLQPYVLELIHPLSSLSANHQLQVARSCTRALNLLIFNLSKAKEKEVWEILNETDAITHLVGYIVDFPCVTKSVEYIQEMASLLGIILWRFPQSRYPVWDNSRLMEFLEVAGADPNPSIRVVFLKLCYAIVLCGYGAKRILGNEELLCTIVSSMETSNTQSVQMEGFKLARCIMMHEEGCSRVMSLYCEPLVKAIVDTMNIWRSHDGKFASDQISLLVEACHLATITRWPGKHHVYFWEMRIDKVLVDLLLPKFDAKHPPHAHLSLEEKISTARESLNTSSLFLLRPYVWDILGSLAVHCAADFRLSKNEDEFHIEILLACACLAFDDAIRKGRQLFLDDATIISSTEAAIRAVQMMIFSPCKFIASRTRSILSEVLEPHAEGYLDYLICMIKSKSSGDNLLMPELLQLVIHLMCLTCYLALPSYQSFITSKGAKTMVDFVTRCLSRPYSLARQTYAYHIINNSNERACCWAVTEDWEGRDALLFYGLWGLAELIHHSQAKDVLACQQDATEVQLFSKLREICSDPSIGGARWLAAYILTYSGLFGFPSKFGEIIGKARSDNDFVDIQLTLADGEKVSVHRAVLIARCPSLLPPKDLPLSDSYSAPNLDSDEPCRKSYGEFTLSSQVGNSELAKVLDYVYLGCLHAEEDMLKRLKILSKSCGLQPLTHLLSRRIPKWGMHVPSFDLAPALGLGGQRFSDIILESKATNLMNWTCKVCSLPVLHMHLHKVVLWASCDYLRAMLQSGMLESHSQVVKVPISWVALQRLVKWFYSYRLPQPPSGCLWQNMDTEEKLCYLEPFIELSWLSEFWFMEELHEECSRTIVPCLDSDSKLSVRVLQLAADLSQWKLVEAAAHSAAGSYRQLNESGALESLDGTLVEMVRAASVRLSQAGAEGPCG